MDPLYPSLIPMELFSYGGKTKLEEQSLIEKHAPKKKAKNIDESTGTPSTSETFLNLEEWENLVADHDNETDEDTDQSIDSVEQ